tara:strand:+ start:2983 stop:4008 length:1026 start_codon:yes stop_codon:yes gene_type:complete
LGQLVFLDEFRKKNEEEVTDLIKWEEPKSNSLYKELSYKSPVKTHYDLLRLKSFIKENIDFEVKDLFVPNCYNGDPIWYIDYENACLNNAYEPYAVMLAVIRDYVTDFMEIVDGFYIKDEEAFEEVRDQFNILFQRLKSSGGSGFEGKASVDEFIRLGSLFFVLQSCTLQSIPLETDPWRTFLNGWDGRTKKISLNKEIFFQSKRLQNSALTTLGLSEVFFRYINKTKEDSLWFFNIEDFEDREDCEFGFEDLFDLLESKVSLVSNRGGKIFICMPASDELQEYMLNTFGFAEIEEDLWESKTLRAHLNKGVYYYGSDIDDMKKYICFTNYKKTFKGVELV